MRTRFDEARAVRAVRIIEELLVHTKGRFARQPFLLAPWQAAEIIRPLFGFLMFDDELDAWVRLYRLLWLELSRKNGKSEILAAIALILLVGDDEEGAEVYGAAKDRDQASKVFDVAARMVELSPALSERLRVYRINKRIVDPRTASFYQVIPGDAFGNLGHNPSGIIFDEIVAQPNRDLWDALRTGFGTRDQPLMVAATTAGDDPTGFAKSEHDFSVRVAENPSLDPRRLVVLHAVPEKVEGRETDPFDESLWKLGNPALGDFLSTQTIRDEAVVAAENPAALKAFKMFRLNQWQEQQAVPYISLDRWDATAGMVRPEELEGLEVIGGLDLSATSDTTSLAWVARDPDREGGLLGAWRVWLPEERLPDLDKRTGGAGSVWVREGFLTLSEGDVIDYDEVFDAIEKDARRLNVAEVGFDRWGAASLVQRLQKLLGEDAVVRVGQGYRDLSAATKELKRLVHAGSFRHGGNPVLRWQIANTLIRTDEADNEKPDRKSSRDKIDAAVATIIAIARLLERPAKKKRRVAAF